MTNEKSMRPVVAIVGATASGKSELAMKLAKKYGGEIISADSRAIYKGMDIGTAKPSSAEQTAIPHHGLDLITPDEVFSAAEFKRVGHRAIKDINKRGKLPLIVGGTGLYVDGLIYDFEFGNKADPKLRQRLENMSLGELQKMAGEIGLNDNDLNFTNRRHLSRAIERGGVISSRKPKRESTLIIGMAIEKDELNRRIETRIDKMLEAGFSGEVEKLVDKYGVDASGLLAPGYKDFTEYLAGNIDMDEARQRFIRSHKKLAKRQITWFKRNPDIVWVRSFEAADNTTQKFLAKFATIHA